MEDPHATIPPTLVPSKKWRKDGNPNDDAMTPSYDPPPSLLPSQTRVKDESLEMMVP